MGGSRRGKGSKGKSKSNKSDAMIKKPEAQTSSNYPDGSENSEGKNTPPNRDSATIAGSSGYSDNEMEELIFTKLERLYTEAKDRLLKSGYSKADIEKAILNNGYVTGTMDPLNNILANAIGFLEEKAEVKGEAFKDMSNLYKAMLEALISRVIQDYPKMERLDAMSHLLVQSWGTVPLIPMTSDVQDEDLTIKNISISESCGHSSHSKTEDIGILDSSSSGALSLDEKIRRTPALKSLLRQNVPIVAAAVRKKIGCPVIEQKSSVSVTGELPKGYDIVDSVTSIGGYSYEECLRRWLETDPDDPRIMQIRNWVNDIRQLEQKVKEQKDWAHQKVIDCAKRLSKDFPELNTLRMDKVNMERCKNEKLLLETSHASKLMEIEQSMRKLYSEAELVTEAKIKLETDNAQLRADTEVLKLETSEYNDRLKEVLKREQKCLEKLADIQKQTSILKEQLNKENQRVLQLKQEVIQVEKEAEEAEIKWKQEIKEKEQMLALLAEETRISETHKANSRSQLLQLRQQLEVNSQLARDERRRLEDELSHLRASLQSPPDISNANNSFVFDIMQAPSLEPSSSHRDCMICSQRDLSTVFLPCTHQVICSQCNGTVGSHCPHCHAVIQESIMPRFHVPETDPLLKE